MLIRKRLTADEFSPPNLRYDIACDCVQFSPDGGETWYDQPSNDPRTSLVYQLPHLTGSDVQCRAAEGMTQFIRQLVNQRIELDTQLEIAGGILGLVAFIPGFNVLYALIIAFAALAVTIARELLEAAFTEDDYDQIRCIFFCTIDSDGVMDADAFADAYDRMGDLNDLARTWCRVAMDTFGFVGFTDAGISLEAAADCECECGWCYQDDLAAADGSFATTGFFGTWTSGQGWTNTYADGGGTGYNGLQVVRDFGAALTLNYANIRYYHNSTSANYPNPGAHDDLDYWNGSSWVNIATLDTEFYAASLVDPISLGGDVSITTTKIRVTIYAGLSNGGDSSNPGGNCRFFEFTFAGSGEEPFGESTCP